MMCRTRLPNTAVTVHVLGCGHGVVTHTEQTSVCALRPSLFCGKELALVPAMSHQLSDHFVKKMPSASIPFAESLPESHQGVPGSFLTTLLKPNRAAAHITAGGVGTKPHTNFPLFLLWKPATSPQCRQIPTLDLN